MNCSLVIPKNQEEEARNIAKQAGGKLLYDPDDQTWIFAGKSLPSALAKYEPAGKRIWALDVPFTDRAAAQASGATWSAKFKAWTYEGSSLPLELQGYLPNPYSWEERQGTTATGIKPSRGKPTGIILHPHQVEAKRAITNAITCLPGFLLADEVGLGKTYAAWAGLLEKLRSGSEILIVAPLAVLPVWREAITKMGDGGHSIIIMNYERLKKLFESEKKVKTLKGLARHGNTMKFDAIIWDESHYLKSMASDHPAARAKLAEKLYQSCKFNLWLSATAGQNIMELGYLKPLLTKIGGKFTSLEQWCKDQGFNLTRGDYGKWLWEPSAQEEERLHKLLFKSKPSAGLRRQPQEVAGWPEIKRIPQPIELDNAQKQLYRLAWAEFIKVLELDRIAGKISTNGLTATLRLRQKASLLKVQDTAELAEELIASGKRVPISVEFLDSLRALEEEFNKRGIKHTSITGTTKDKEANRLYFQSGKCDVILFTVKEGISLHEGQIITKDKPRAQIVHDLRWSGISQHQIDGRSHRDGKYCPIYWMVIKDTIEEAVAQKLLKRMEGMAGIMGDTKEILMELMNSVGKP